MLTCLGINPLIVLRLKHRCI